jgi:hypothetical protein
MGEGLNTRESAEFAPGRTNIRMLLGGRQSPKALRTNTVQIPVDQERPERSGIYIFMIHDNGLI